MAEWLKRLRRPKGLKRLKCKGHGARSKEAVRRQIFININ